ncbi:HNH endonuclease, partial [Actinomyces viscosus]
MPAATAWCLAAGGTWRRLVTDPLSGTVIDVGRSRYRPPA